MTKKLKQISYAKNVQSINLFTREKILIVRPTGMISLMGLFQK